MSKSVIKTKFAVLQTPTKFAVIMEIPPYYLTKAEMDILQILSQNKEDGKCTHSCYFSVLILAICKKCLLVLASEAHLYPRLKEKKMSPSNRK